MTAVTLVPDPAVFWGVGNLVVLQLWCCFIQLCWFLCHDPGVGFVGWEPHSGRVQSCSLRTRPAWVQTLLKDRLRGVVCGVSYRPISTGQLHESLVLASTSGLSTQ